MHPTPILATFSNISGRPKDIMSHYLTPSRYRHLANNVHLSSVLAKQMLMMSWDVP